VTTRVIGAHNELSICPSDLSSAPNGEWIKNLSDVLTWVEFESFRLKFDPMKTAGILNYRDHHFFRLHCVSLPFRNFFVPLKPVHFMVHIEEEP
jgi:hypothetical protein